jgi:allantoate deiminase
MKELAQRVMDACQAIALFSETPGSISRTYLSPPFLRVHDYLRAWMDRLGIDSRIDAAGNLRGVYPASLPHRPRLLIGSHIDTVPDAGAFDGVLGVVAALALIEALGDERLAYSIEVIAFSEEEGVRFGVPFIGSRALTGEIDATLLTRTDAHEITLAQAIEDFGLRSSELADARLSPDTFAFIEFHIEQGPVLEALNIPLGIVEAIVGQSRYELAFSGKARHSGTTPMHLRHDPLAGAAEWIAEVERKGRSVSGLVATVGRILATPNTTNVIPGRVRVSLDVRHAENATRHAMVGDLLATARMIARTRGLALDVSQQMDEPATPMNPVLTSAIEAAVLATGPRSHRLVSGAGHDAMVLGKKVPAGMLFLRSPGGISHHPDESVLLDDIQAALNAGLYFLKHLDPLTKGF